MIHFSFQPSKRDTEISISMVKIYLQHPATVICIKAIRKEEDKGYENRRIKKKQHDKKYIFASRVCHAE